MYAQLAEEIGTSSRAFLYTKHHASTRVLCNIWGEGSNQIHTCINHQLSWYLCFLLMGYMCLYQLQTWYIVLILDGSFKSVQQSYIMRYDGLFYSVILVTWFSREPVWDHTIQDQQNCIGECVYKQETIMHIQRVPFRNCLHTFCISE